MTQYIHTFVSERILELQLFQSWWFSMHLQDQDNYPQEMESTEWEEQFQMWKDFNDHNS